MHIHTHTHTHTHTCIVRMYIRLLDWPTFRADGNYRFSVWTWNDVQFLCDGSTSFLFNLASACDENGRNLNRGRDRNSSASSRTDKWHSQDWHSGRQNQWEGPREQQMADTASGWDGTGTGCGTSAGLESRGFADSIDRRYLPAAAASHVDRCGQAGVRLRWRSVNKGTGPHYRHAVFKRAQHRTCRHS